MSSRLVGILNTGLCNVFSMIKALKQIEVDFLVVKSSDEMGLCSHLIMPGVGSFDYGIKFLEKTKIKYDLNSFITQGKPVLGICLGMQLLMDKSEESLEGKRGLSLIPGSCSRIESSEYCKVPHCGWNNVSLVKSSRILNGIEDGTPFYFIHSFACNVCKDYELGLVVHGKEFTAICQNNNIYGVQFHPEKSGKFGLLLLKNFTELSD